MPTENAQSQDSIGNGQKNLSENTGQKSAVLAEAGLIEHELTIRKLRLPPEARLTKKSLLRWVALSLGLISPGETRDAIIPVLDALFYFQVKGRKAGVNEFKEYIDKQDYGGIGEKTLRYQLMKLRDIGFVEKEANTYYFVRDPYSNDLKSGIFSNLDKNYSATKGRLEEALSSLIAQYLQA